MQELIAEFVTESSEGLEALGAKLIRLETHPDDGDAIGAIFRLLHTIKGTSGFIGLPGLGEAAHQGETLLQPYQQSGGPGMTAEAVSLVLAKLDEIRRRLAFVEREGREPGAGELDLAATPAVPPADERQRGAASARPRKKRLAEAPARREPARSERGAGTVRVSLSVLDDLMRSVSELVLTRNQLLQLDLDREDSPYAPLLQRLSTVTRDLQNSVMASRMQPIGVAWQGFPRLVRDLSAELGKSIELILDGEETSLDRQVVELIRDPLTHMVRNSVDHGLEGPEARLAAGKPAAGALRLSARHQGGDVIICIADDGRGLNTARIREKALERGLITADVAAGMSGAQIHQLIFTPGFSTAEQITDISGRGVGMDVVRANVEQIGGRIEVSSTPGQGAAFTIILPLTLAIAPALIVGVAGQRFAVVRPHVREVVRVGAGAHPLEGQPGRRVLHMRSRAIPIVEFDRITRLRDNPAEDGFVLVIQSGARLFGLRVDAVLGAEDIVVKPLSAVLRSLDLYSGAAVLGDGAVVLILDTGGLAARARRARGRVEARVEPIGVQTKEARYLVFQFGGRLRGVDLSRVDHVARVRAGQMLKAPYGDAVDHHGRAIPVLSPAGASSASDRAAWLIVVADPRHPVAIRADEIVGDWAGPAARDGDIALGEWTVTVVDADMAVRNGAKLRRKERNAA